MSHFEVYDMRY